MGSITVIVGLIDEDYVWIGGDRLATLSDTGLNFHMAAKKVWSKVSEERGLHMIMGAAGSARGAQLMEYSSTIPPIAVGQSIEEYLIRDFTVAMKQALHEGGELHDKHNVESAFNHLLLGFEGRLFSFYSDFGFEEVTENYAAIGSGARFALGSLHTSESMGLTSEERITKALEAASHFNAYVGPPYDIVKIAKPKHELTKDPVGSVMDKILNRANEMMAEEEE